MLITFILSIIIIILIIVIIVMRSHDTLDAHLENFIALNNNMTVITSKTKILFINEAGLTFLNIPNIFEFKKKYRYLSNLFTEINVENNKYIQSIDWVTKVPKTEYITVEMYDGNLKQIFNMQVSKIKEDRYQVVFYNISRILAEKDAIEESAVKDELTKIYNRKKFNSTLSVALRNAEIHEETFSIILFDIDHFKQVNDTHGHNVGDKVLIQLSALVKGQLRDNDVLARWGGEEFVILSQSSNAKQAYFFASRLRKIIESFSFDTVTQITCSFGVSQHRKNDTALKILKRADDVLYEAKENGRNQVCM